MTGNPSTRSVGMSGANEPKPPTPMGGASVSDVLSRLEAAECGSRELDGALMALDYRWEHRHIGATCWDDYHGRCCPSAKHLDWVWVDPVTDKFVTNAIEGFEFTSSLDRALALANRVLDIHRGPINVNICLAGSAQVTIYSPDPCGTDLAQVVAPTPALALCTAILRARQPIPAKGGEA